MIPLKNNNPPKNNKDLPLWYAETEISKHLRDDEIRLLR